MGNRQASKEFRGSKLRLHRAGAIAAITLWSPGLLSLPPRPALAQAAPRTPLPAHSVCRGAELLPANHPDIQRIQTLVQKYKITGVPTWGQRPITRYDLAIALHTILGQLSQSTPSGNTAAFEADLRTLQRLQQEYPISLVQHGGGLTLMRPRLPGTSPRATSPVGIFAPPALPAPSPVGAPPPANLGQAGGRRAGGKRDRAADARIIGRPQPAPSLEDRIDRERPPSNTEGYNPITDNPFFRPGSNPLSTFSIDVDTASYSNIRRFIRQGQQPPKDAVRIEEMINYFAYDYPEATGDRPFSLSTDVAPAPWNPKHQLVHIGLKGQQIAPQAAPPSNLVFLIDVSGSMNQPNKLPLVKQSLCLLVNELKPSDRVSMVVYAGSAGLVLPPTAGDQKATIMAAIDRLESGGSTAGGAGIELAYKTAQKHLVKGGNNRVILATDGDFNVGASSDAEMVRLVEQKRDQGIYLTVLGFGTGNYKDSKMELLADKGNGNYAYIDTLLEAKKVLVTDLRATLFTIAKDVKIQVEFNPVNVQAYRLVGYENRLLNAQDFNDDKKDAGEIGAGHTVTALYEIIPTGIASDVKLPDIDPLKYQPPGTAPTPRERNELLQVKVRYKAPSSSSSQLLTRAVMASVNPPSANLQFSSAVAMFGMILRDSEFKGTATVRSVLELAQRSRGQDTAGYRDEFIQLVQTYDALADRKDSTQ
jgi:Ca-activated chloride channel homolog